MTRRERITRAAQKLTPERRKLWKALEATSKAFEEVPVDALERQVAQSVQETRAEMRREQQASEARARKDYASRPA